MKKLISILFLIILASIFNYSESYASTSFAVNADIPLYGVNFDLNDTNIIFRVLDNNNTKVFYVQYNGYLCEEMNGYLPIVAMNDKGFFISCQIQSPAATYTIDQTIQTIEIGSLAVDVVADYSRIDDVIDYIGGQLPINSEASLHSLFADLTGATLIIEAGNVAEKRNENFTLMTDLPLNIEENKYSGTISEEEKESYVLTYNRLLKDVKDINVDKAFAILESSSQEWRGGGTQCSMVFDPEYGEVYLALNRDYTKIWKVSLAQSRIETWKGFTKQTTAYIGEGITSEEILHPDSFLEKYGLYMAVIAVIMVWIIIGSIVRRKRIRAFKPKEMEW